MRIEIKVLNLKDLKKNGTLKAKKGPERAWTFFDVEPLTDNATDKFLVDVAQSLKKSHHDFTSPYIFTHINALNEANEPVRICEDVVIGGGHLMTTPQKLYKLLTV